METQKKLRHGHQQQPEDSNSKNNFGNTQSSHPRNEMHSTYQDEEKIKTREESILHSSNRRYQGHGDPPPFEQGFARPPDKDVVDTGALVVPGRMHEDGNTPIMIPGQINLTQLALSVDAALDQGQ